MIFTCKIYILYIYIYNIYLYILIIKKFKNFYWSIKYIKNVTLYLHEPNAEMHGLTLSFHIFDKAWDSPMYSFFSFFFL